MPARIRPTGIKQGDLVQLLYEIGVALISEGSLTAAASFTITVENVAGTTTFASALTKVIKPSGLRDDGMFCQLLYEIVSGMIASVGGCTAADFTVDVQAEAREPAPASYITGSGDLAEIIKPGGIEMGVLAQLLYEIVECLIDDVTGVSATDFTLDVEDRVGNLAGVSG